MTENESSVNTGVFTKWEYGPGAPPAMSSKPSPSKSPVASASPNRAPGSLPENNNQGVRVGPEEYASKTLPVNRAPSTVVSGAPIARSGSTFVKLPQASAAPN